MAKLHAKRISAPKTWPIKRKIRTFTTRGFPNGQKRELTLPLNTIIRDLLNFTKTAKEVRYLLKYKKVNVNGKRVINYRKTIGFMDVIEFPELKESYRLLINTQNKLFVLKEKDDKIKIAKITSKKKAKNTKTQKDKVQLGFDDGNNVLIEEKDAKNYKLGDSVLVQFGEKLTIKQHISFEKGKMVFMMGGKHVGNVGKIVDILDKNIIVETEDKRQFNTSKKYGLIVGDNKPLITLTQE